MKGFRGLLDTIPTGVITGVVLAVILWLTLAPHPTGDLDLPLFPGADKIVHGIMFFGLAAAVLLDVMKRRKWVAIPLPAVGAVAFAVAIVGILIEVAQRAMGLGRSMETLDILADAAGAFLAAGMWAFCQDAWALPPEDK